MKLEKHRYIIFRFFSGKMISEKPFINAIWDSIYEIWGVKGASETGLWLIDFDNKNNRGIIRCNLKSLKTVKIALILMTHVQNVPIMIQIIGISGTIKTGKEKFYTEKQIGKIISQ
jgi:ribonuclease P/MRP protein subunit POP5